MLKVKEIFSLHKVSENFFKKHYWKSRQPVSRVTEIVWLFRGMSLELYYLWILCLSICLSLYMNVWRKPQIHSTMAAVHILANLNHFFVRPYIHRAIRLFHSNVHQTVNTVEVSTSTDCTIPNKSINRNCYNHRVRRCELIHATCIHACSTKRSCDLT